MFPAETSQTNETLKAKPYLLSFSSMNHIMRRLESLRFKNKSQTSQPTIDFSKFLLLLNIP